MASKKRLARRHRKEDPSAFTTKSHAYRVEERRRRTQQAKVSRRANRSR